MPSHNALKCDAGGKKGKLLCCKCIFNQIKGNLVEIQFKNHQNVQKTHFLRKVPGVNGLNICWSKKISIPWYLPHRKDFWKFRLSFLHCTFLEIVWSYRISIPRKFPSFLSGVERRWEAGTGMAIKFWSCTMLLVHNYHFTFFITDTY